MWTYPWHTIAADRTGPGGIMEETNDIDANGFWTIDNYEALMGLLDLPLAGPAGGDANWAAPVPVLFQLPAFVNNIAHASTGTVDQKTGTVTLGASARSVTVQLKQAA